MLRYQTNPRCAKAKPPTRGNKTATECPGECMYCGARNRDIQASINRRVQYQTTTATNPCRA
eukprot:9872928-Alexandrium_andersonii.AAC.1